MRNLLLDRPDITESAASDLHQYFFRDLIGHAEAIGEQDQAAVDILAAAVRAVRDTCGSTWTLRQIETLAAQLRS